MKKILRTYPFQTSLRLVPVAVADLESVKASVFEASSDISLTFRGRVVGDKKTRSIIFRSTLDW